MSALVVWFSLGAALGTLNSLSQHWLVAQLGPNKGTAWIGLFGVRMLVYVTAAALLLFFSLQAGWQAAVASASGLVAAQALTLIILMKRKA